MTCWAARDADDGGISDRSVSARRSPSTSCVTSTTGCRIPAIAPVSSRSGLKVNVKYASSVNPWRVSTNSDLSTCVTSPCSTFCIHG
jgi:hypothetical protein